MKPEVHLALLEAVDWDMGMHAAVVVRNGIETPRDRYGDGWNAALMELHAKQRAVKKWFNELNEESQRIIGDLLLSDWLGLNIGEDNSVLPYLNANDTFYYSCADAEEVEMSEIQSVLDAFVKFKRDGILAWMSIKRKMMPLEQLQTKEFKEAYKTLSEEKK